VRASRIRGIADVALLKPVLHRGDRGPICRTFDSDVPRAEGIYPAALTTSSAELTDRSR
jgi:hypothetical protein